MTYLLVLIFVTFVTKVISVLFTSRKKGALPYWELCKGSFGASVLASLGVRDRGKPVIKIRPKEAWFLDDSIFDEALSKRSLVKNDVIELPQDCKEYDIDLSANLYREVVELSESANFSINNVSIILLILTTFLIIVCVISYIYVETTHDYVFYSLLLIIQILLYILFLTNDLLHFFLCFEGISVPLYFLIFLYGSELTKIRAAVYFMGYSLLSSVFLCFGTCYIFFITGTTNIVSIVKYYTFKVKSCRAEEVTDYVTEGSQLKPQYDPLKGFELSLAESAWEDLEYGDLDSELVLDACVDSVEEFMRGDFVDDDILIPLPIEPDLLAVSTLEDDCEILISMNGECLDIYEHQVFDWVLVGDCINTFFNSFS